MRRATPEIAQDTPPISQDNAPKNSANAPNFSGNAFFYPEKSIACREVEQEAEGRI
jgi:hypothetical protein